MFACDKAKDKYLDEHPGPTPIPCVENCKNDIEGLTPEDYYAQFLYIGKCPENIFRNAQVETSLPYEIISPTHSKSVDIKLNLLKDTFFVVYSEVENNNGVKTTLFTQNVQGPKTLKDKTLILGDVAVVTADLMAPSFPRIFFRLQKDLNQAGFAGLKAVRLSMKDTDKGPNNEDLATYCNP